MDPFIEELIDQAEVTINQYATVKGFHNLVLKMNKLIIEITAEAEWLDANESNPAKSHLVPGKIAKIKTLQMKLEAAIREADVKAQKIMEPDGEPKEMSVAEQKARAILDLIQNNPDADTHPGQMLQLLIPDTYVRFITGGGRYYIHHGGPFYELTTEDYVKATVRNAWIDQASGRAMATAKKLSRLMGDEISVDVGPVLDTWDRAAQNSDKLYTFLQDDPDLSFSDELLGIEIDGAGRYVLDRYTGALRAADDPFLADKRVLLPFVHAAQQGESRAIDAMVAHHFKTQEEIDGFYRICGISLFGIGIPNLVFLYGSGGSGKDMLFALMRAVHGERMTVSLNSQALSGTDESNDLARLKHARFALCSYESAHAHDGSYQPNTLKSITSGGTNAISVRMKYAKEAEDIFYKGSLWLYGNKVPNLTGSGDVDGLDRRFTIIPMRKRLPQNNPPKGFTSWPDAVVACAPVFAYRCLKAYIDWREAGSPGFMDARQRTPDAWKRITEEHLLSGSRFGFLRDLFFAHGVDETSGLPESVVYDIMEIVYRSEKITRMGRSTFPKTLNEMMSIHCRFQGMGKMEADERDGVRYLPININPEVMERLLSTTGAPGSTLLDAKLILQRANWDETTARYLAAHDKLSRDRKTFFSPIDDESIYDQGGES